MLANQCSPSDPAYVKRISDLAYKYWEGRGCPLGSSDEDWYRAEREIAREGGAYGALRFDRTGGNDW